MEVVVAARASPPASPLVSGADLDARQKSADALVIGLGVAAATVIATACMCAAAVVLYRKGFCQPKRPRSTVSTVAGARVISGLVIGPGAATHCEHHGVSSTAGQSSRGGPAAVEIMDVKMQVV